MKPILILLIGLLTIAGADQGSKDRKNVRSFRVSETQKSNENRQIFKDLWDSIQFKIPEVDGKQSNLVIMQALKPKEDGLHLYIAEYLGENVAVLLQKPDLLEDQSVKVWIERNGIYDGVTVMGAAVRREKYREVVRAPRPDAPTAEEFLLQIKAGKTYEAGIHKPGNCKPCFGNGKLGALRGRKECRDCEGRGSVTEKWVLKW